MAIERVLVVRCDGCARLLAGPDSSVDTFADPRAARIYAGEAGWQVSVSRALCVLCVDEEAED
jgi:hypothetical protein